MKTTAVEFVNIHGQRVDTSARVPLPKKVSDAPAEYHKGYVVEGLPPGSQGEAKAEHERARAVAIREAAKRIPEEWNELAWLQKAKAKRVRTKPYELLDAAEQCKALAEKAGWLRVSVRAMSKGVH